MADVLGGARGSRAGLVLPSAGSCWLVVCRPSMATEPAGVRHALSGRTLLLPDTGWGNAAQRLSPAN